jgi:hypothetical protein
MTTPTNPRFQDITGHRFGRWTVVSYAGRVGSNHQWLCRCDCGAEKSVQGNNLKSSKSRSCGCLHSEVTAATNYRHGHRNAPEYGAWCDMKSRCLLQNRESWENYGGRGIRVCDRWLSSFETFLADVGPKPSPRHSLDRYPDVNGNYEPGNVRWATPVEQANNTRANRHVDFGGKRMSVSDAARLAGLKPSQVYTRLHDGWSVERALTSPIVGRWG